MMALHKALLFYPCINYDGDRVVNNSGVIIRSTNDNDYKTFATNRVLVIDISKDSVASDVTHIFF